MLHFLQPHVSKAVSQTYENVTGGTESSQYEMTKSEPASLPSEYTELSVSELKMLQTKFCIHKQYFNEKKYF